MEPRISIITLGVSDLGRSTRFYRDGLGFPEHEAGGDEITFLALTGQLLGLYPRDALADDIGRSDQKGTPQPALHGFTIAHNVATRAEVDSVLRQAATAGARIVKPAAETFWGGYSGYFADPDGFLWEVATGSGLPIEPGSDSVLVGLATRRQTGSFSGPPWCRRTPWCGTAPRMWHGAQGRARRWARPAPGVRGGAQVRWRD